MNGVITFGWLLNQMVKASLEHPEFEPANNFMAVLVARALSEGRPPDKIARHAECASCGGCHESLGMWRAGPADHYFALCEESNQVLYFDARAGAGNG